MIRRGDAMDAMNKARSAVLVRVPHDGLRLIVRALRGIEPDDAIETEWRKILGDSLDRELPPSMRTPPL